MNHRRRKQTALAMIYLYGACLLLPPVPLHAIDFPRGDINGDGAIDADDLPGLRDLLLRRSSASRALAQGDLNQDGRIDSADLLAIRTYDGDFDGDGIPDTSDAFPANPALAQDADDDGIGDSLEIDADNDGYGEAGLPPGFEGAYRVDAGAVLNLPGATTSDSDGDGLSNSEEDTSYDFTYPPALGAGVRPVITDSLLPDTDRDGLSDGDEKNGTTDALNPDTDGDGVLDGVDAEPLNPGVNRPAAGRGRGAGKPARSMTATQAEKNNAWIRNVKQKYAEHLKRAAELRRQGKQAPRFELAAPAGGSARGLGFSGPSGIGANFDSVQSDPFTGAFSYSIPIKVPPGRNGMQPELALVYRSTNSHSWVGIGWDLNPGRIERSTKDGVPKYTSPLQETEPFPNDGDPMTPLDNPDTFVYVTAAGGSELVFTGETEDASEQPVGIYHCVVDQGSFVRFLYHASGGYWEAQGKDGRRMFFGGSPASNPGGGDLQAVIQHPTAGPSSTPATYSWALAEEWDLHGDANKISYAYDHPLGTNNMHLDQIEYNFVEDQPQVTIDFETTGRAGNESWASYRESYRSKMQIISNHFLTGILQSVNDRDLIYSDRSARVRRYQLAYGPLDPNPGHTISRLVSVQEFGESDSDAYPPITMNYSANLGQLTQSPYWSRPNGGAEFMVQLVGDRGTRIADLNGDALPDLWQRLSDGSVVTLDQRLLNTGTQLTPSQPDEWNLSDLVGEFYRDGLGFRGTLAVDLNADGKTDLWQRQWESFSGTVNYRGINNDGTITSTSRWAGPTADAIAEFNRSGVGDRGTRTADLNGDGLVDLWQRLVNGALHERVFLNTGRDFLDDSAQWRVPPTDSAEFYNDDVLVGPGGVCPTCRDRGTRVADLNGDGLADLWRRNYQGGSSIHDKRFVNTGGQFVESPHWSRPMGAAEFIHDGFGDRGVRIADLNGDGLPDLWQRHSRDGTESPCNVDEQQILNTGLELVNSSNWSIPCPGDSSKRSGPQFYWENQNYPNRGLEISDINGDGLPDLWQRLHWSGPNIDQEIVLLNSGPYPNLLTSIDNGIGGTVEVEYSPQTKYWMKLHDPDASRRVDPDANGFETNNHVPYVIQTVSKITRTSRRPNHIDLPSEEAPEAPGYSTESYATLYRYSGGLFKDREFRGFGKVKEIDAQTGNFTITEFHQDYARKGMPRSVRSYVSDRRDYRTDGQINGPIRSRNDAPANFETAPAFGEPKLVSEAYNRYRVAINANDPNVLKPFTTTDELLGIEIPEGMTLVTPASAISRVYEYGGDYGQDPASVPILVTAQEQIFDGRGNPTQVINYGKVDVLGAALDEPRPTITFADDTGADADGRVVDMTTYKQVPDRSLTWMDVPETVNKSGFHTLADGRRETDTLKTLQAQTIAYDGLLRPSAVTRHLDTGPSPVTQYEYDAFGNVTRIVDPNGNESLTAYETQYNTFPTTMTNALGHATIYVVDPGFGNLLEKTDPNGRTRSAAYDGLGRMTAMLDSSGTTVTSTQYAFWSFSGSGGPGDLFYPSRVRTTTHTPTGNAFTEEHFDGLGRNYQTLTRGQRGADDPIRTVADFNDRGLVWRQSHPHWTSEAGAEHWSYTFFENDDLTTAPLKTWAMPGLNRPVRSVRELSATQNETTLTVYETPLEAKSINARGHEARARRDAFGNRIAVTEPGSAPGSAGTVDEADARTTTYGYDGLGRLEHVRRAFGENPSAQDPVTKITYDTLSRRTRLDDPDSGVSEYQFDANGNLTSSVDARGEFVVRSYDSLNRLATVNYFEGAALRTHQYTYDAGPGTNLVGRLAAVQDPACLARYSYDNEGRTIEVSRTIDGQTYTTQSEWDFAGRETLKTYPDGMQLEYGFDANTQALETVEIPGGQVFLADKQASQFGSVETFLLGNGVERTNFFDYAGRAHRLLTTSGAGTLSDLAYSFDANSNVARIQESAGPAPFGDMQYEYDPLNRLTKAYGRTMSGADAGTAGAPLFAYAYDPLGRMTSNARFANPAFPGATPQYAYASDPAASGPYHAVQSIILDHPTNPDVTAHQFTYDAAGNMLSSADGPGALAPQNDLDRINTWDALGRLRSVTRSGVATLFTYDANNNRIKKSTLGGETVTYVGDLVEVVAGQMTKHIFAGSERIATIEPGGAIQFYTKDHLGSSAIITDAAGAELQRMDYEPYGALIANGRSGNDESIRHTYTGQESDGETGLMHYNARYYDPIVGAFTSADSIVPGAANPQAFNRYCYVFGNPIMRIDPSGNFSLSKFLRSTAGQVTVGVLAAAANALAPGTGAGYAISGAATLYMNKDNLNRSFAGGMMIKSGNWQLGIAGSLMMGGNSRSHLQNMKMNAIYGGINAASMYMGASEGGGSPIAAAAFAGGAHSVAGNNGSFHGAGRAALAGGAVAALSVAMAAGLNALRAPGNGGHAGAGASYEDESELLDDIPEPADDFNTDDMPEFDNPETASKSVEAPFSEKALRDESRQFGNVERNEFEARFNARNPEHAETLRTAEPDGPADYAIEAFCTAGPIWAPPPYSWMIEGACHLVPPASSH